MPYNPKSLQNLGRGRAKGLLNKRTRLFKRLDPEAMDLSLTPKEAMAMAMGYYQRKVQELLECLEKSKAEGILVSELGPEMRLIKEYQDAMVDCAAKLAPYIHPRLANVEVKTEQTQPFVIRVPQIETDAQRWSEMAGAPKVIDAKPVNGSGRNGTG